MKLNTTERELLEMALLGLMQKAAEFALKIAEVQIQLGKTPSKPPAKTVPAKTVQPRKMSASGRQRIALAQKKRWAATKRAAKQKAALKLHKTAKRKRAARQEPLSMPA